MNKLGQIHTSINNKNSTKQIKIKRILIVNLQLFKVSLIIFIRGHF